MVGWAKWAVAQRMARETRPVDHVYVFLHNAVAGLHCHAAAPVYHLEDRFSRQVNRKWPPLWPPFSPAGVLGLGFTICFIHTLAHALAHALARARARARARTLNVTLAPNLHPRSRAQYTGKTKDHAERVQREASKVRTRAL